MPIRPSDTVQYIKYMGPDFRADPASFDRHDPDGEPQVGDYGEVVAVDDDHATIAWRFGATTQMAIEHLVKHHARGASHRYRVLFESSIESEDVVYHVRTEGGAAKAVYMATCALTRDHPDRRPYAIEVEDLGDNADRGDADLLSWDEVS